MPVPLTFYLKDGLINYPTLMSLEGTNDEIDPAAFYIIGATSNATFSPDNLTCTDWPCNATKFKVRLTTE